MISKERLEELMRNCAVIYGIEFDKIESYDLSDEDICISPAEFRDYGLRIFNSLGYWNDVRFENLFESKEEAEWYKEFGNITRTERLGLPTWEIINKEFKDINKFGSYAIIDTAGVYMDIFVDNYKNKFIVLTTQPRMLLTKENYTLACRKCKELFLGGSDGDIR